MKNEYKLNVPPFERQRLFMVMCPLLLWSFLCV